MGLPWYRMHRDQENTADRVGRYPTDQYRQRNRERMARLRADPVYRVREEGRAMRRYRSAVIARMREELAGVA